MKGSTAYYVLPRGSVAAGNRTAILEFWVFGAPSVVELRASAD